MGVPASLGERCRLADRICDRKKIPLPLNLSWKMTVKSRIRSVLRYDEYFACTSDNRVYRRRAVYVMDANWKKNFGKKFHFLEKKKFGEIRKFSANHRTVSWTKITSSRCTSHTVNRAHKLIFEMATKFHVSLKRADKSQLDSGELLRTMDGLRAATTSHQPSHVIGLLALSQSCSRRSWHWYWFIMLDKSSSCNIGWIHCSKERTRPCDHGIAGRSHPRMVRLR